MKSFFTAVLLFSLTISNSQNNWTLDKAHTSIRFEIGHLLISEVEGKFTKFDGEISSLKDDDFSDVKISFTIDLSSVDTGDKKRDNHLQEKVFFDTKNHPNMIFKSVSVKKVSDGEYTVKGNFTLRGVTKKIVLNMIHNGTIKDPFGSSARAGLKINGIINRTDFGIEYNKTMIGEEIKINCKIELTR